MTDIEFVHLHTIQKDIFLNLMNNEKVRRYLPLLQHPFSEQDYEQFLKSKQHLWDEFGYGPLAIKIKGEFAGWGGLQPENGDADFALVLHPDFWGWGYQILNHMTQDTYKNLSTNSITILLPPDRIKLKFLRRLGFLEDGHIVLNEQIFKRFRLTRS